MKTVTPLQIQKFIIMLQGKGVRNDGKGEYLSATSVRRYFTVLKSVFGKAYKLGLISSNPTETDRLDLPSADERDIQIFSEEEAGTMITCLNDEPLMYQALINVAVVTGMRRGEIVALQWKNVDFNNNSIAVVQSAYKIKDIPTQIKPPKTKKSTRHVSIPDYLVEMLRELKSQQEETADELKELWHEGDWVFTQWNGEVMNPCTPTAWFSKFLKRHNLPHRKFHALRHTSATLMLVKGINVKNVASRLGHTQLSTTNRYVHALQKPDIQAANTFELMFADKVNERETGAKIS